MRDLLRVYLDPAEIGKDGYPFAWHQETQCDDQTNRYPGDGPRLNLPIKDLIRDLRGHRCERCGHPYRKGEHGNGEWSACDERCTHAHPFRVSQAAAGYIDEFPGIAGEVFAAAKGKVPAPEISAKWRILTVHHLNGIKHDCRWWNLVALCQRCHLSIQGRVTMARVYPLEHSDWFKPYAAGWYASAYLGEDLTREETIERLDELLALERQA